MKHLIKNNQIVQSGIPSHFTRENGEGFWGGYETRTDLHYEDGWRDEVVAEFTPRLQSLGEAYYDKDTDTVRRDAIGVVSTICLESEKSRVIAQIKRRANADLNATDWYITRRSENGTPVPDSILEQRAGIRARTTELESAILSLETVQEVLIFKI